MVCACLHVYVCVHVVREGGATSASMCGEVWDLVMA